MPAVPAVYPLAVASTFPEPEPTAPVCRMVSRRWPPVYTYGVVNWITPPHALTLGVTAPPGRNPLCSTSCPARTATASVAMLSVYVVESPCDDERVLWLIVMS